jgi:hypothetical protein
MKRAIGAFFAGLLSWAVVVSLIDRGLRLLIPGYAVAEPQLQFTLTMMLARLGMAALTSVIAGAVVGLLSSSARVPWILGALILAVFLPEHIHIWHDFPAWYHLTFLLPLVPLVVLGAHLTRHVHGSQYDASSAPLTPSGGIEVGGRRNPGSP